MDFGYIPLNAPKRLPVDTERTTCSRMRMLSILLSQIILFLNVIFVVFSVIFSLNTRLLRGISIHLGSWAVTKEGFITTSLFICFISSGLHWAV